MKKIAQYSLVLLAFCSSIACYKEKEIYNRSVETEKYGKMLLGRQTKSQLRQEPFNSWFDEEYNSYEYDPQVLKELKKNNLIPAISPFSLGLGAEIPTANSQD